MITIVDKAGSYREVNLTIAMSPKLLPHFQANPHLCGKYSQQLQASVLASFQDKETSMREPTEREAYTRMQIAQDALSYMINEMNMGIIQSLDLLPDVLVRSLKQHYRIDQVADSLRKGRWSVDDPDGHRPVEIDVPDMNEEA